MKLSKYIWKIEKDNTYLIYSTITKAIIEIEKRLFDNMNLLTLDQINELLRAFILIPDEVDEGEILRKIYSSIDREKLAFVYIPTFRCNLNCEYCYQKEYSIEKRNARIEEIIAWLESQVSASINTIGIQLYGGEPLLCKDSIISLIKGLKQRICDINIVVTICTNGLLLDNSFLVELQRYCEIENIQITVHDIEALFSSYHKKVIQNIEEVILNNNVHLTIKFDVDKENNKFVNAFLDKLKNRRKFHVVISPILKTSTYSGDKLFERKSFILLDKVEEQLRKEGYDVIERNNYTCKMLLNPNAFVIDPQGDLYKCDAMAGKKEFSIGNIKNYDIHHSDINYKEVYFSSLWNQPHKCGECEVMPLCMGNCRYRNQFRAKEAEICYKELIVRQIIRNIDTSDNIKKILSV